MCESITCLVRGIRMRHPKPRRQCRGACYSAETSETAKTVRDGDIMLIVCPVYVTIKILGCQVQIGNFVSHSELMSYSVYILTNWKHTVYYTGVTNNLVRRIFEHKVKLNHGFTSRFNCNQLMYYEEFQYILYAIHREKQIKKYRREWKRNLITSINPEWRDLSEDWYDSREFEAFEKG